jgi:hypothetical protein
MKKTILAICTVCITSVAMAQDDEGNKMWIGGMAGISSSTEDNDDKSFTGVFGPNFGYMLNEKMAIGLGLTYTSTTSEDGGSEIETKSNVFEIAPFFRYYKSLGDNCALYGELEVAIGSGKTEVDGNDAGEYSTFGVGIAPGIQYWFHENWSINTEIGALGFDSTTDKSGEEDYKSSSFEFGLDLTSLTFGLNFHF